MTPFRNGHYLFQCDPPRGGVRSTRAETVWWLGVACCGTEYVCSIPGASFSVLKPDGRHRPWFAQVSMGGGLWVDVPGSFPHADAAKTAALEAYDRAAAGDAR